MLTVVSLQLLFGLVTQCPIFPSIIRLRLVASKVLFQVILLQKANFISVIQCVNFTTESELQFCHTCWYVHCE